MTYRISAIANDRYEYACRCEKYEENVQYSKDKWNNDTTPDCYGEHSKELRARELKEPA